MLSKVDNHATNESEADSLRQLAFAQQLAELGNDLDRMAAGSERSIAYHAAVLNTLHALRLKPTASGEAKPAS